MTSAGGVEPGTVRPTFREAVRFWWTLGWISFAGPAGQIATMDRELVERRRWISERRFLHALSYCMALPGPEAQQLATYVGFLLHGTRGGVVAGALFVLPYLLFSGYAGGVADSFNKRTVLIVAKSFEILVMLAAFAALGSGNLEFMLAVIFLTALQASFFSPAHYGILPELLPERELSRANGLDELCVFLAIILGTTGGAAIYGLWQDQVQLIALVLVAIATVGTVASLGRRRRVARSGLICQSPGRTTWPMSTTSRHPSRRARRQNRPNCPKASQWWG